MSTRASRAANANSTMRWFWYALIGIGLVFVILALGDSFPAMFDHRHDKWVQLGTLTVVVFGGYLYKLGWRYRRRATFWGLYLILFLAHCALFVPVFLHGSWHIPLLAVVGSCEIMALAALIALAMGEKF